MIVVRGVGSSNGKFLFKEKNCLDWILQRIHSSTSIDYYSVLFFFDDDASFDLSRVLSLATRSLITILLSHDRDHSFPLLAGLTLAIRVKFFISIMKNILVPIDFSKPSIEAFKFAVDLSRKSHGSITVLHVLDLPVMAYGVSVDMPVYTYDMSLYEELKAKATIQFNQLNQRFGKGHKKIKFSIEQGLIFPAIRYSLQNKNFDLVVMGTHGASGLKEFFVGSNTEKVVRFSKAPVLAVRKYVPLSSIKNIVYPTTLESGQTEFIKQLKALQKFFHAKLHILYLNTPFNFVRDNEVLAFVKNHRLTNYTINIRHDRYERDGIISFAKEIKANMLAMPTHARKGLSHFISGSVSEDVVNHIQSPIWTYAIKK